MEQFKISVLSKYNLSDPTPGVSRVWIMRGRSPLGNPFPMRDSSARERVRVIDRFRSWLRLQYRDTGSPARRELERLYELAQVGPLELVCCCAPMLCHGHVILDALQGMHKARAS